MGSDGTILWSCATIRDLHKRRFGADRASQKVLEDSQIPDSMSQTYRFSPSLANSPRTRSNPACMESNTSVSPPSGSKSFGPFTSKKTDSNLIDIRHRFPQTEKVVRIVGRKETCWIYPGYLKLHRRVFPDPKERYSSQLARLHRGRKPS